MITRIEAVEKLEKINKEIEVIKEYMKALKNEDTMPYESSLTKVFFRKKTIATFFSLWNKKTNVDYDIPPEMCIDVYVLCQKWVSKLEKEANEILGRKDKKGESK